MAIKIFVGSLPMDVTNDSLKELFENYGTVTESDVLGSFGFIHMSDEEEAKRAIAELHGYSMNGSRLSVEMSTSSTQGRSKLATRAGATTKIFVGNVSKGTSKCKLQELFETYGTVTECDVLTGYGFVHMDKDHEAFKAIKGLNGYVVDGNRINVELSNTGGGRSRDGFGGGRGGGGRGGRNAGGMRYDPYSYSMAGPMGKKYGSDSYDTFSYASDPYARSSRGPPPSESFARDLLELYTSNPSAFDAYARDPMVRQSLHLPPIVDKAADPYYAPSQEYLERRLQQARSGASPYASPSDYALSSGVGATSAGTGWNAMSDSRSVGGVASSIAKGRGGGAAGQLQQYTSFE